MREQQYTPQTLPDKYGSDMVLEQHHHYPISIDSHGVAHWVPVVSLIDSTDICLNINFEEELCKGELKDDEVCRRLAARLDGRTLDSYNNIFNRKYERKESSDYNPTPTIELFNTLFEFSGWLKTLNLEEGVHQGLVDAILRSHLSDINLIDDHPDGLGKHIKVTYYGCDNTFAPLARRYLNTLQNHELYMFYCLDDFGFNITIGSDLILNLLDKYIVDGAIVKLPSERTIADIVYNNKQVNHSLTSAIEMLNKTKTSELFVLKSADVKTSALNRQ